jgi:hypothetical protein
MSWLTAATLNTIIIFLKLIQNDVPDVCIDSYLQSVCSKILKRAGKIEISELLSEAEAISTMDVQDSQILNAIQKIVEKGLGETRGETIEYIQ